MVTAFDVRMMRKCLSLATKGGRSVEPNPLVGCVIVKDNRIVGTGWHRKFGGPHAEKIALDRSSDAAHGSTLYVNLEPCNHFGKTPPCTDPIIASGIKRVVIGMKDPNPIVSGKGIMRLREAKIECEVGVLEEECRRLNARFVVNMVHSRPYVILKVAQTLDGFIATVKGQSKWITSEDSRKHVHELRASVDAILVGANTVRMDNPSLTVRYAIGENPVRVVLSSSLKFKAKSEIFSQDAVSIVLTTEEALRAKQKFVQELRNSNTEFVPLKRTGQISIARVLQELYRRGIKSLLIEGGRSVFSSFVQAGYVDRFDVFVAPVIIGQGLSPFDRMNARSLENAYRTRKAMISDSGNDAHFIIHNLE